MVTSLCWSGTFPPQIAGSDQGEPEASLEPGLFWTGTPDWAGPAVVAPDPLELGFEAPVSRRRP